MRRISQIRGVADGASLYLAVALGAALGGVARAAMSMAMTRPAPMVFPWDSLLVNAAGSFLIGLYAGLVGPDGRMIAGTRSRHFVMTGLCGGFTSFSVFSLESFRLIAHQALGLAGAHIAASVVAWLGCVWLGALAARRLNRLGGA